MDRIAVIIVAGGSGQRMGTAIPKQFLELAGKPVLAHTVERFAIALPQAEIVVVLPSAQASRWNGMVSLYGINVPHRVCEGGPTRFGSVKNALDTITGADYVVIHDGVRPLVSQRTILDGLRTARNHGTAVPVIKPADSFRVVDHIGNTPIDRETLRIVQTPQVFAFDLLRNAYKAEFDRSFTDDASVVERTGIKIALYEGEKTNIKITEPADLRVAEIFLKEYPAKVPE